jgi:hypothetical protein
MQIGQEGMRMIGLFLRAKFRPIFRPFSPCMAKKSPVRSHMHGEKAKSRHSSSSLSSFNSE